ncbi:MAG: CHAD domain-containing protein [Hyphomicrobiales bacterium]
MASIRTDRPAGEALLRLARKTLARLAKDLGRAAAGGGIHAARRRLKFMRSLLRLLRPAIGKSAWAKADHRLRAAAHAIAGARRAEALQEAVAKLGLPGPPLTPALAELARLAAAAHGHEAEAEALSEAIAGALRGIEKVRGTINHWGLPKRDVSPFVTGLRDAYAMARRKLRAGLAAGDIARLHEARKSVIHHLHHLEILEPLWPEPIRVWKSELTSLREALGDLNDLRELEHLAAPGGTGFSTPAMLQDAQAAIAGRRARLLAQVSERAGHRFAEKPGAFAKRLRAMWRKPAT